MERALLEVDLGEEGTLLELSCSLTAFSSELETDGGRDVTSSLPGDSFFRAFCPGSADLSQGTALMGSFVAFFPGAEASS